MTPPTNIDGSAVQSVTIDGVDVQSITIDGQGTGEFSNLNSLEVNNTTTSASITVNDISGLLSLNGDNLATVRDSPNETGDYQIQKDGNDTTGVINFKTQ
jgi:hypothetical protein